MDSLNEISEDKKKLLSFAFDQIDGFEQTLRGIQNAFEDFEESEYEVEDMLAMLSEIESALLSFETQYHLPQK